MDKSAAAWKLGQRKQRCARLVPLLFWLVAMNGNEFQDGWRVEK